MLAVGDWRGDLVWRWSDVGDSRIGADVECCGAAMKLCLEEVQSNNQRAAGVVSNGTTTSR
jgi:hypothetical protein